MTTSRLSRLRNLVSRVTIEGVRKKQLDEVGAQVRSFADIGGPSAAGGWIDSGDQPMLFERDSSALEQDLIDLWRRHGRDQLVPLAAPIAQLASKAQQDPLTTERQVSSTVYAMQ